MSEIIKYKMYNLLMLPINIIDTDDYTKKDVVDYILSYKNEPPSDEYYMIQKINKDDLIKKYINSDLTCLIYLTDSILDSGSHIQRIKFIFTSQDLQDDTNDNVIYLDINELSIGEKHSMVFNFYTNDYSILKETIESYKTKIKNISKIIEESSKHIPRIIKCRNKTVLFNIFITVLTFILSAHKENKLKDIHNKIFIIDKPRLVSFYVTKNL